MVLKKGYMVIARGARCKCSRQSSPKQMREVTPSPSLPRPLVAAGCWQSRGSLTRAPETPKVGALEEGYMVLKKGYMVIARGACKCSRQSRQRTQPKCGP